MPERWKDATHLFILLGAFIAFLAAFTLLRRAFVPAGFGSLGGHYNPSAITKVAARTPVHAGQDACAQCHADKVAERAGSKHVAVHCESCHGPQGKHAANGGDPKPKLPETPRLCVHCHEKDSAKPKDFPQVVTAEHSGGLDCKGCHAPHHPLPIKGAAK